MPYPKPLSPSAALAAFHTELARSAVNPDQAATGPALWPRFAGYYQGLARLPRRLRRALQRRWRRSLGGSTLLCALGQAPDTAPLECSKPEKEIGMSHLFLLILLALPLAAQAIVIDNGIPVGTVGHWSVDVLTGGATQSAVFTPQRFDSPDVVTENVVSSYRVFVDPGIDGQGFELQGSEPEGDIFDSTLIRSSGTFIGANGNTVRWFAASKVFPGVRYLATTYTFDTAGTMEPIGPLRVFLYLDGDVHGSDDDISRVTGNISNVGLSTLDNVELFGVSQSASTRGNSTFAGSVVDGFDQIRQRIVGSGQPASTAGTTINLPSFQHPQLNPFEGPVHGPANVVSVLAWDVTPGARGTIVDTFLQGIPPPPPTQPPEEECEPDDENGDVCAGPVAPVRKQFSCRSINCTVAIACNLTTECVSQVKVFVTPEPTRLRSSAAVEAQRRFRFAAAVANVPPGQVVTVRPKLTKRGRAFFRANRNRTIRGVMMIRNAVTGGLFSSTPVRIRLK